LPASVPEHFLAVHKDVNGMVLPVHFPLESLSKLTGYSQEDLQQCGFLEDLFEDGPKCRAEFFREAKATGKCRVRHYIRTRYGRVLMEFFCIFKNGYYRVSVNPQHCESLPEYAVV